MFGFWFANGFYDFVPCPFGLVLDAFPVNHYTIFCVCAKVGDMVVRLAQAVPETYITDGLI